MRALLVTCALLHTWHVRSGETLSSLAANLGTEKVRVEQMSSPLSRVVQLASTLTGEGDTGVIGVEDTHGQSSLIQSEAPWTTPDSAVKHLHDSFDPATPSLWEQISGGEVGDDCGAVSGQALCFNGAGGRYAVTAPVNTIAGGIIRFSLHMGFEDGLQSNVVLEYKSIGRGWEILETYEESTYEDPAYSNPNGGSLVLWEGGSQGGYVPYAVVMPPLAQSAATKFRWRQQRELVSGLISKWSLDDISLDVDILNPAVQLSAPSKTGRSSTVLTVVVQFSQPVDGFDVTDVKVQNGTVAGLSRFNAKILGAGDLYTCLIKPQGEGDSFDVVVQVSSNSCLNKRGHGNLGSNVLVLKYDRTVTKSRAEMAFGPRPGPADAKEVAAFGHSAAAGIRPLRVGEVHPDGSTVNVSQIIQDPDKLKKKLDEAEAIFKRLQTNTPPPPAIILEKLQKEISTLKQVQKRMLSMDAMLGLHSTAKNTPHDHTHGHGHAHAHEGELEAEEELHHIIHDEMDELRKEREEMARAMEEQRKMREELLLEREKLKREREDAAKSVAKQHALLEAEEAAFAEEARKQKMELIQQHEELERAHAGHDHGHVHSNHEHQAHELSNGGRAEEHDHSTTHEGHDHTHSDAPDAGHFHPEGEGHAHAHEHAAQTSAADFGDDSVDSHRAVHREFDAQHHDIHAELQEMSAQREELEADLAEQRKMLYHKKKLREEMATEREELKKEHSEIAEEKEELARLAEQERQDRATWAAEQRKLMEEMREQQRSLREEAEKLHAEHEAHDHGEHNHENSLHGNAAHDHQTHDHTHMHDGHDHALEDQKLEEEKQRIAEEKLRVAEERAALVAEREQIAKEKEQELEAEKERLRAEAAAEQAQRDQWALEQRRFMDELMAQQRALKELMAGGLTTPATSVPGAPASSMSTPNLSPSAPSMQINEDVTPKPNGDEVAAPQENSKSAPGTSENTDTKLHEDLRHRS